MSSRLVLTDYVIQLLEVIRHTILFVFDGIEKGVGDDMQVT